MKEGLIKDAYELLLKELQTIVTATYIIAVGIGMLFNYQKFSEFDINIFEYADVFDFLIAPFSDFYILIFAALSISIFSIVVKLNAIWKNKWPKFYSRINFGRDKKSWFKTYRMILLVLSFGLYLYLSADFYGKYVKERIINDNFISIVLSDDEIKSGKLIGKTKDVIFLINEDHVYALPISSTVKEIRIK